MLKEKDVEAVNEALANGHDDPLAMLEIAKRLENPDAEVRTAAREAAVHLGDTNILPYLNAALDNLQDPREKVAIMDAIAYLQIPLAPQEPVDPALAAMLTNPMPARGFAPPTNRRAQPKANPGANPAAPAMPSQQQPPAAVPQSSP